MTDFRDRVRTFITTNFYVPDPSFSDGASLLDAGIVDSTCVLEVIAFLEAEFGIAVADEEMLPDNLDSVTRIVAFVERKKG